MSVFLWILLSTLAMSLIAWIGLITLYLNDKLLNKILLPLVALSAGALLGGAFLHMIPEALEVFPDPTILFLWVLAGFTLFFLLEQFIHWHHCHRAGCEHTKKPVTYLILVADGLHNFIGGLAIAGAFLVDIRLGLITWLAAAAHEIPQELGDFGILIHGGWHKRKALIFNFLSALTVVLGGLVAYFASQYINVAFLLPFAAGNFIYIAASDLMPEIKMNERMRTNIVLFFAFLLGIGFIYLIKFIE